MLQKDELSIQELGDLLNSLEIAQGDFVDGVIALCLGNGISMDFILMNIAAAVPGGSDHYKILQKARELDWSGFTFKSAEPEEKAEQEALQLVAKFRRMAGIDNGINVTVGKQRQLHLKLIAASNERANELWSNRDRLVSCAEACGVERGRIEIWIDYSEMGPREFNRASNLPPLIGNRG